MKSCEETHDQIAWDSDSWDRCPLCRAFEDLNQPITPPQAKRWEIELPDRYFDNFHGDTVIKKLLEFKLWDLYAAIKNRKEIT